MPFPDQFSLRQVKLFVEICNEPFIEIIIVMIITFRTCDPVIRGSIRINILLLIFILNKIQQFFIFIDIQDILVHRYLASSIKLEDWIAALVAVSCFDIGGSRLHAKFNWFNHVFTLLSLIILWRGEKVHGPTHAYIERSEVVTVQLLRRRAWRLGTLCYQLGIQLELLIFSRNFILSYLRNVQLAIFYTWLNQLNIRRQFNFKFWFVLQMLVSTFVFFLLLFNLLLLVLWVGFLQTMFCRFFYFIDYVLLKLRRLTDRVNLIALTIYILKTYLLRRLNNICHFLPTFCRRIILNLYILKSELPILWHIVRLFDSWARFGSFLNLYWRLRPILQLPHLILLIHLILIIFNIFLFNIFWPIFYLQAFLLFFI